MNVKCCIGIISYLPQKWSVHIERYARLVRLIDKLNLLFNLPIILIAQNYKETEKEKLLSYYSNITILEYPKLGIAGAREALRKEFLKTDFTDIILFDDDCNIVGDENSVKKYLNTILDNSGKLGLYWKSLHKLMCLGRKAAELLTYDLKNTPEEHLAYEDRLAVWTFVGNYPDLCYKFDIYNLKDTSASNCDKDSSWSKGLKVDKIQEMWNRTNFLIEERTNKSIIEIYKTLGFK